MRGVRRIGEWRPWKLATAWAAYWVALSAVTLAPAMRPVWRATHAGPGKGNISFSFSNTVGAFTVHLNGASIYHASASVLVMALWIAVPPLALWVAWLVSKPRPAEPVHS